MMTARHQKKLHLTNGGMPGGCGTSQEAKLELIQKKIATVLLISY